MEMKQSETFFHGTYSNLMPYLFYQKTLAYFTELKRNGRNETKSDIFQGDIFKSNAISFLSKILKYFNDFHNQNFSFLWLKWTQAIEIKQNQAFF